MKHSWEQPGAAAAGHPRFRRSVFVPFIASAVDFVACPDDMLPKFVNIRSTFFDLLARPTSPSCLELDSTPAVEDGDDRDALRHDPALKIACDRAPEDGLPIPSQPTISRLENGADTRALYKIGIGFIDLFCRGYAKRRTRPPPLSQSTPSRSPRKPPARSVFEVDAIDIARKIGTRDELRQAVADARAVRKARNARKPLIVQLLAELQERWRATTGLKPPKPRPRRQPPPARDKRPRAGYRDR